MRDSGPVVVQAHASIIKLLGEGKDGVAKDGVVLLCYAATNFNQNYCESNDPPHPLYTYISIT